MIEWWWYDDDRMLIWWWYIDDIMMMIGWKNHEQLPMVQRIMNMVEKTSTGVTPAALILNNSIRLTERILLPPTQARSSGQFALSDTMDEWIARQSTLINVAREKQRQTDFHALVNYDPTITEYPVHSYALFTPPVGRSDKLLPRCRGPFQVLDRTNSIYTIEDLISGKRTTTHIHKLRPFSRRWQSPNKMSRSSS